jgi:adenylylsulfate kinase-like enzyme
MIRPVLITIRGNSASGKSTVADGIRSVYGRGVAIVGQDLLRRQVLRELPAPGGVNVGLIDLVARHALDHGYHTIVEGILEASVYGDMLMELVKDHRGAGGPVASYYLDVPLEETLRRHAGKSIAAEVSEDQLRRWYLTGDVVPGLQEVILGDATELPDVVSTVLHDTRLLNSPLRPRHLTWDVASRASRWR